MSSPKKSLLRVEKLQFDIFINKQLIQVNYDDQTTVDEILNQVSQNLQISSNNLALYLAKKSGEPKLSFPALQGERQLLRTNERRFVVVIKQTQCEILKQMESLQKDLNVSQNRQKKQNILQRFFGMKTACN